MASGVQTEQSDHAKAEEKLSIEEFRSVGINESLALKILNHLKTEEN